KSGVGICCFFFSSRRRHTRSKRDWSSDVALPICDYIGGVGGGRRSQAQEGGSQAKFLMRLLMNYDYAIAFDVEEGQQLPQIDAQIGRASCRERVYVPVGEGRLKRKENGSEGTLEE